MTLSKEDFLSQAGDALYQAYLAHVQALDPLAPFAPTTPNFTAPAPTIAAGEAAADAAKLAQDNTYEQTALTIGKTILPILLSLATKGIV